MNFIETIKAFFQTPKVDPLALATHDAFWAASDAYDTALDAIESYTARANHRYEISIAPHDEAVSIYTDPADFEPYTEAYLDAHATAIDTLTEAFDNLTSVSAAYPLSAKLYKAYCAAYAFAASAYSNAVHCAKITALEGSIQAAKDELTLMELNARAANSNESNPVTAKAKADAFKAKAVEHAAKAELFEEKVRLAEKRSEEVLAKAKFAEARAEKALDEEV